MLRYYKRSYLKTNNKQTNKKKTTVFYYYYFFFSWVLNVTKWPVVFLCLGNGCGSRREKELNTRFDSERNGHEGLICYFFFLFYYFLLMISTAKFVLVV